jgi:hypothetical protein
MCRDGAMTRGARSARFGMLMSLKDGHAQRNQKQFNSIQQTLFGFYDE